MSSIYLQMILIVYWPEDLGRSESEERIRIIIQGYNKVSQEDFQTKLSMFVGKINESGEE